MTLLGKIPDNGWEIPNFIGLTEYKFLEDTYDAMLCMQNINACSDCCRGIMHMRGLEVMPSMIVLCGEYI